MGPRLGLCCDSHWLLSSRPPVSDVPLCSAQRAVFLTPFCKVTVTRGMFGVLSCGAVVLARAVEAWVGLRCEGHAGPVGVVPTRRLSSQEQAAEREHEREEFQQEIQRLEGQLRQVAKPQPWGPHDSQVSQHSVQCHWLLSFTVFLSFNFLKIFAFHVRELGSRRRWMER